MMPLTFARLFGEQHCQTQTHSERLRWTRLIGQKIGIDLGKKRGHVRGGVSTARPDSRRRSSSIPGELYPPRKHLHSTQSKELCKSKLGPSGRKRKIPEGLGDSVPQKDNGFFLLFVRAGTNLPVFGSRAPGEDVGSCKNQNSS